MKQELDQHSGIQVPTKIYNCLNRQPIVSCNKQSVLQVVFASLSKAADLLGVQISDSTLAALTEDLCDKYKNESPEDLLYCLKRGRQGYYGNNFGKLNMIILTEWMVKHLDEKYAERERLIQEERKLKKDVDVDYRSYIERMEKKRSDKELRRMEAQKKLNEAKEYLKKNKPKEEEK